MKSLQKTTSPTLEIQIESSFQFVRQSVIAALTSIDNARQQCVIAGHLLLETKATLEHGDFGDWLKINIPEISWQTATTWMRAASNVSKALHFGHSIEIEATVIPISQLLSAPLDELPAEFHEARQQWFDFTADKTIKDCINACVVDGDPDHRMDRAMNGKLKGGTTDRDDRKAFHQFVGVKLEQLHTHITHWKRMTPVQKNEITGLLVAFATGEEFKASYKPRPVKFTLLPIELREALAEALRISLKPGKGGRAV